MKSVVNMAILTRLLPIVVASVAVAEPGPRPAPPVPGGVAAAAVGRLAAGGSAVVGGVKGAAPPVGTGVVFVQFALSSSFAKHIFLISNP